jgi:ribosome-associated protein
MDSKKLAQLCRELAENKKAEDVVILDVRKFSDVTDFFVIASAGSEPQLRAIESEILDRLRDEHQVRPHATDGHGGGSWIVADFFDVIVHLMRPEVRDRYDLEGLWSDAPRVARPRKARSSKTGAEPESAS